MLRVFNVDYSASVVSQKFATKLPPRSAQKSPLPLPSSMLRTRFSKEGFNILPSNISPFEKGEAKGDLNPISRDAISKLNELLEEDTR